jgi:hypothetical protein
LSWAMFERWIQYNAGFSWEDDQDLSEVWEWRIYIKIKKNLYVSFQMDQLYGQLPVLLIIFWGRADWALTPFRTAAWEPPLLKKVWFFLHFRLVNRWKFHKNPIDWVLPESLGNFVTLVSRFSLVTSFFNRL